ncbi:MAG TPA: DUF2306 domain-containing protein [Pyrinomonadaceae bacterium]|nr:DUF2306 domain-containing protein [Pyrinomonadaceae bacterium]
MIRTLKIAAWLAMLILALLIAVISFRYFILSPELAAGPPLAKRFAQYITPLLFHAGGGIVALSLGPWGFWNGLRNRYLRLHRWMGRIYLLAVLVGSIAGLYLAATAFGGLPTRIGFGMLGALWLISGVMAYLHIRRGNVQIHRQWMIRNYALTFSAVMLRLWLPLFFSLGYEFTEAYTTVAWLCWVPNLLVAEVIISNGNALAKRQPAKLSAVNVRAA